MLGIIKTITLGLFLLIEGMRDFKYKKISMRSVIIFAVLGVMMQWFLDSEPWKNLAGGILIGAGLWLLAWATREKIGYGDAYVVAVIGVYLGWKESLCLLLISLMFTSAFAIILLIAQKVKKKSELPFVPFLFGGFIMLLLLNM